MNAETKRPKFLIEDLRHIADHGLTVEFENQKKTEYLAAFAKSDEKVLRLQAGQREVVIVKVSQHCHYVCRGIVGANRDLTSMRVFYHERVVAPGVCFDIDKRVEFSSLAAYTARTFKSLLDGTATRESLCYDVTREHLKDYSWIFFGEVGLRALAYARTVTDKMDAKEDRLHLSVTEDEAELKKIQNPAHRGDVLRVLENQHKERMDAWRKRYHHRAWLVKALRDAPDRDEISRMLLRCSWPGVRSCGAEPGCTWSTEAEDLRFDPPYEEPNYYLTGSDGKYKLSSGVKVPVTLDQLKAFLEGKVAVLNSPYGVITLRHASTSEGEPVTYLKCGCHLVDVSRVPEIESLLPKKPVTRKEAVPAMSLDSTETKVFLRRVLQLFDESRREDWEMFQQKHRAATELLALWRRRVNNPEAEMEEIKAEIVKWKEEIRDAKADRRAHDKAFAGLDLPRLQGMLNVLVNFGIASAVEVGNRHQDTVF